MSKSILSRFTPEEIKQIKAELGVSEKTMGSKSYLLAEQKSRLFKIMETNKRTRAARESWDALLLICDDTIGNYQMAENSVWSNKKGSYHRYSSIYPTTLAEYRNLVDKLLDVIEENKKDRADKKDEVT